MPCTGCSDADIIDLIPVTRKQSIGFAELSARSAEINARAEERWSLGLETTVRIPRDPYPSPGIVLDPSDAVSCMMPILWRIPCQPCPVQGCQELDVCLGVDFVKIQLSKLKNN